MNIYTNIKAQVLNVLSIESALWEVIAVETPKFKGQGDVSLNVAMVLAKHFGKKPIELANQFLPQVSTLNFVEKAEVAGAGFINLYLKKSFLLEAFKASLEDGYGFANFGKGEKVNIEYCSANPTGPIHIGHTRGTIYGDVTSELLAKNGYSITREYYINDAGGQVETLLKSVFVRMRQIEGESIEVPDGCYPGEYLIPIAKKVLDKFGKSAYKKEEEVKSFVVNEIMTSIKEDLSRLKVNHGVFTSEAEMIKSGNVQNAINVLEEKGLLYYGILPKPKGKLTEEWEEREQLLFKSTNFGDSEDRALKKSDGSLTYFTSDIGYHKNKIDRGFFNILLSLGADHAGYVTRITSATKALAPKGKEVKIQVKACQIVKFLQNGEPVKMSKRKGTFTTLAEVLDEVDADILRFILLTKKNDSQIDFDLIKVKEQSKENPIFYIQYAYSRSSSLLRNYNDNNAFTDLDILNLEEEIEIVRKVLEYPKIMEMAVKKLEPHLLANYLYELASILHSFWNMGNERHELRFISNDVSKTNARMMLVKAVKNVIQSAFSIFKITPLEKM
jgi:arginyl-tRNA synthetase